MELRFSYHAKACNWQFRLQTFIVHWSPLPPGPHFKSSGRNKRYYVYCRRNKNVISKIADSPSVLTSEPSRLLVKGWQNDQNLRKLCLLAYVLYVFLIGYNTGLFKLLL